MIKRVICALSVVAAFEPKNMQVIDDFVRDFHTCTSLQMGVEHLQQLANSVFTQTVDDCKDCGIKRVSNDISTFFKGKEGFMFTAEVEDQSGPSELMLSIQIVEQNATRKNETYKVNNVMVELRRESSLEMKLLPQKTFFDQTSAYRLLFGTLTTLNGYINEYSASVYLSFENDNFNVILNCKDDHVKKVIAKPVEKDDFEVGMSQAVLNVLIPWQLQFEWTELLGLVFSYGGTGALKQMESMGITTKTGYVRPTLDEFLISQNKVQDKLVRPKFQYSEKNKVAKLTHTFFIEYQDTTRKAEEKCVSSPEYKQYLTEPESINDLVIVPFEVEMRIDLDVTDNGSGRFPTPEFSLNKTKVKIQECSYAYNYLEIGMPEEEKEKSDEEFDDENEDFISDLFAGDNQGTKKRNVQVTAIQKLICGILANAQIKLMSPETSNAINDNVSGIFDQLKSIFDKYSNDKKSNEAPEGQALTLACSGWDIHPFNMQFGKQKIIFSAKLNKAPTTVPGYCNNLLGEKYLMNPYLINANKANKHELSEIIKERHSGRFMHYLDLVIGWGWKVDENTSPNHLKSPLMAILSNFYPLKDYCETNHPELDSKKCALIYAWYRKYHEYDNIAKNRPADFKIPDYIKVREYSELPEEKNEFDQFLEDRFDDL